MFCKFIEAICTSTPLALKVASGGPGFVLAEYLTSSSSSSPALRARTVAALQALRAACINRQDAKTLMMMFSAEQVLQLAGEVVPVTADLAPQTALILHRVWDLMLTWIWQSEENQKVLLERPPGGLSRCFVAVLRNVDEIACPSQVIKIALDCLVQLQLHSDVYDAVAKGITDSSEFGIGGMLRAVLMGVLDDDSSKQVARFVAGAASSTTQCLQDDVLKAEGSLEFFVSLLSTSVDAADRSAAIGAFSRLVTNCAALATLVRLCHGVRACVK